MPGGEEGTNQEIGRRKRSGKLHACQYTQEEKRLSTPDSSRRVGSKGEQVGHIQCRKPFMWACTITSHHEFISK